MAAERPRRPDAKIRAWPRPDYEYEPYGLKLEEGQTLVDMAALRRIPGGEVYTQGWIDPARVMRDPRTRIDARLWEGSFEKGRLRESRVSERLDREGLQGRHTRLRESLRLKETDWWAMGVWNDYPQSPESPLTSNFVPLIPGPATRQQYWADYWASSAKCFEAQTHSGIGRRVCNAMVQFPLGRGVKWEIPDATARQAWEAFWKANKMRRRFKAIMYDLATFGEQFLRYFVVDGRLVIRQLDPATIYEIVTDQEDDETVFFYHQQFQTRHMLYPPPPGAGGAPQGPTEGGVTRYIIRQISAPEIDHYKIHTVSGEVRGRSDLFPALSDLKRVRDLVTSKVIQADIVARVMAILKANGTAADLNRVLEQIFPGGQPPPPATVVALNEATDMTPFEYTGGREVRSDFTYDELIDSICAGVEIPRPYLGISPAQGSGSTQAAALTTVEPSVKAFDDRQELADTMLHEMFDRVMATAHINGEVKREFIFPSTVKSDRTSLLQDLATAEGMNWIGGRRAANTAAAEFDFTDYDYDSEMAAIAQEFKDADSDGQGDGKIRRPMIMSTYRQEPRLDPTTKELPLEDEPMGLGMGQNGSSPPGAGQPASGSARPQPRGAGGIKGKKNPASASNGLRQRVREVDGQARRHPKDPGFIELAEQLERETTRNIERLLQDVAA